ncbi:MAG: heavy metal-binding domain-containing protein [Gammaproteobacteria bacterium]|nr:heavy metal-binding domain-containing protein [Gammaproteobacteria bacterium]
MANPVKLLSIEALPGDCSEVIGLVTVSYCVSRWVGGDVVANFKNWTVGGELKNYTQLIDKALEEVSQRLCAKAEALGAKAVIGVRFGTTQVAHGAAELIGYGTAVR